MSNWINEWTGLLYAKNFEWNMISVSKPKYYSKDVIRMVNKNNTYLKASLGMYKELYILQGKLYSESYVVLFMEKV